MDSYLKFMEEAGLSCAKIEKYARFYLHFMRFKIEEGCLAIVAG